MAKKQKRIKKVKQKDVNIKNNFVFLSVVPPLAFYRASNQAKRDARSLLSKETNRGCRKPFRVGE